MPTDIEIAQAAELRPIADIAREAGLAPDQWQPYGRYVAKVDARACMASRQRTPGRLVLVSAMTPTPAGEGKTTMSIALADGLRRLGKRAMLALREPSLGPVFGMKGGATGGGYAQVLPMENINLHFTGDLHAITAANNLLCAMVDNSVQQGNPLHIDPRTICFRRCMDMNDRQLRDMVCGLGGKSGGVPREAGFEITAASEVMAAFCLAGDLMDLRERLGNMRVARTDAGAPVTCRDIGAQGAMAALLRDAIMPNLVQTIEGTPALVHGGPFANIAHGCNTVTATRLAMAMADYTVTEAGFGADLGAEKFIDIKCRLSGLRPDCAVLVATVRALKYHGGVEKAHLNEENIDALRLGLSNLKRHLSNMRDVWSLPCVVALNRFSSDTEREIDQVRALCEAQGVPFAVCEAWEKGGAGALTLAERVMDACDAPHPAMTFTYADSDAPLDKIKAVACRVYGAADVALAPGVMKTLEELTREGACACPVCIAKTQYSLSDNAALRGAPEGFTVTIRDVRLSAGAGFLVAYAGSVITMPGLPAKPAAMEIDVDDNGRISGLF